jgi:hypothetical protein
MANSSGMCGSFKAEAMTALHALGTTVVRGATTADTLKAALYLVSGSLAPGTTTAYSATSEVSGTNYSAGGITVTNATAPTNTTTTGFWTPSGSLVYSNVTLTTAFDTVLIYNSTQSNRAISIHNFGSQTITAATLTLTMPTNAAGTALLNIA